MRLRQGARLVLATTLWKRPELTEVVLGHYLNVRRVLSERMDLVLLAAGSEGLESRSRCERYGFEYVEARNRPVTHKWNAVVRRARRFDPEGLVLVNSDDIIFSDYLEACVRKIGEGHDFFGLKGTWVFDLLCSQVGRWPGYEASHMKYRVREPAGCGRCYSRKLLEQTDWTLWPEVPGKNYNMDFFNTQYLRLHGFEPRVWPLSDLGVQALQIKSGFNITSLDRLPLENVDSGEEAWRRLRQIAGKSLAMGLRKVHLSLKERMRGEGRSTPYRYRYRDRGPVSQLDDLEESEAKRKILREVRAMNKWYKENKKG